MVSRFVQLTGVLALVFALVGCAAPPGQQPEREAPDRDGTEVAPDAEAETEASPPEAVHRLMADARGASEAGEHDRAAALLERALQIDPHNAVLWHNLAIVRYRAERYADAASMAERSNRHTGDNHDLEVRNWELIAASRALRGDEEGAHAARREQERLLEASQ